MENNNQEQKVIVIDNEPRWLVFAQGCEYDVVFPTELDKIDWANYDLAILGALHLDVAKSVKVPFVVVTASYTDRESIDAYRTGARKYTKKVLNATIFKAMIVVIIRGIE